MHAPVTPSRVLKRMHAMSVRLSRSIIVRLKPKVTNRYNLDYVPRYPICIYIPNFGREWKGHLPSMAAENSNVCGWFREIHRNLRVKKCCDHMNERHDRYLSNISIVSMMTNITLDLA